MESEGNKAMTIRDMAKSEWATAYDDRPLAQDPQLMDKLMDPCTSLIVHPFNMAAMG